MAADPRDMVQHNVKCGECGAQMKLRSSTFGIFYGCSRYPKCKGAHGAHQKTGAPLGIPADSRTKGMRIKTHAALDRLWSGGAVSRGTAYAWLAEKLGISSKECHVGRFDYERCEKALATLAGVSVTVVKQWSNEQDD